MSAISENQDFSSEKLGQLRYILDRVRGDLHARRCKGRTKPFEYFKRPKTGAPPEPITEAMLRRHITAPGDASDAHLGIYPLRPNDETILAAAIDFDDHDGSLPWEDFISIVRPVINVARRHGLSPWCVRSGGGHGLHCWFFWLSSRPQRAVDVRALLTKILAESGFEEGSDGGVQARVAEIFPKQCAATETQPGNLIALPFARDSCWLDSDLQPTTKPQEQIPTRDIPPMPGVAVLTPRDDASASTYQGGDIPLEEAIRALNMVSPDCGYALRNKLGMALKVAFGDEAFPHWLDWIKKCKNDSYKGEHEHRYHWKTFKTRKNGKDVSLGTLLWHAKQHGWERPASAKPSKLSPLAAANQLLKESPEWGDVFAWNDFSKRVVLLRPYPGTDDDESVYPRDLTDNDTTRITIWLQNKHVKIASGVTHEAISEIAHRHSFHPVREYLRGLEWDGVNRGETWLIDHLGAEDTPFNRAVAMRWLIAAVARVMKPGCLVKTVLVLEGPQDLAKSSALRVMAVRDEWFIDRISDLTKKDAMEETQGIWIVEFAEFDAMTRADATRVKSFISTTIDKFRPSYGRLRQDFPRQWVGAATINPGASGYLKDTTGNVRFWPVECAVGWEEFRTVDLAKLREARDQLWAEAVARYDAEEKWWIEEKELKVEQRLESTAREKESVFETPIREMLNGVAWATTNTILQNLGFDITAPGIRAAEMEVSEILSKLGWVRYRAWTENAGPNGIGRYFFPPGTTNPKAYGYEQAATVKATMEEYRRAVECATATGAEKPKQPPLPGLGRLEPEF